MGIDIGSKLLVGLPYEEIVDYVEFDEDEYNLEDFLYEMGIESCSHYYDSPLDARVYGIPVKCNGNSVSEVLSLLVEAQNKFLGLIGKNGKVYQLPDVT